MPYAHPRGFPPRWLKNRFFYRSAGACPPRASSIGEPSRARCFTVARGPVPRDGSSTVFFRSAGACPPRASSVGEIPGLALIRTRMSLLPVKPPPYRARISPKSTKRFIKPQQFFSDAAPIVISFHARAALFAEFATKGCIGEQPKHRFCKRFRRIGDENFLPDTQV